MLTECNLAIQGVCCSVKWLHLPYQTAILGGICLGVGPSQVGGAKVPWATAYHQLLEW